MNAERVIKGKKADCRVKNKKKERKTNESNRKESLKAKNNPAISLQSSNQKILLQN